MRVTVCQLHDSQEILAEDWERLVEHVEGSRSDLVLLPELPFSPWLPSRPEPDTGAWREAVREHESFLGRLGELPAAIVVGTRPVWEEGHAYNRGFLWLRREGFRDFHSKFYLPEEEGFWEARWYRRGAGIFPLHRVDGVALGMLICTELWFTEHARRYARQGIHLLLCPRATEKATAGKWLAGGRAAAVLSGAFCLSSNRGGKSSCGLAWGGLGWIIDPDGNVLATTSDHCPFITLELDLKVAEQAKSTYPRYVRE